MKTEISMTCCLAGAVAVSAFVAPSAFTSSQKKAALSMSVGVPPSSTNVNALSGADVETGGVWDPLGLANDEERLYKFRAGELKNGRVAMLAVIGTLVQSFYHLPDPVFANGAKPLQGLVDVYTQRPEAFWQIFLAVGIVDNLILQQDPNKEPGDLGFGAYPDDADELAALKNKELKNGRLAMLAIVGQFVQEKLTGQGPWEQILSGHISPFGDGQGAF